MYYFKLLNSLGFLQRSNLCLCCCFSWNRLYITHAHKSLSLTLHVHIPLKPNNINDGSYLWDKHTHWWTFDLERFTSQGCHPLCLFSSGQTCPQPPLPNYSQLKPPACSSLPCGYSRSGEETTGWVHYTELGLYHPSSKPPSPPAHSWADITDAKWALKFSPKVVTFQWFVWEDTLSAWFLSWSLEVD